MSITYDPDDQPLSTELFDSDDDDMSVLSGVRNSRPSSLPAMRRSLLMQRPSMARAQANPKAKGHTITATHNKNTKSGFLYNCFSIFTVLS